jgi:ribosome-associated protein
MHDEQEPKSRTQLKREMEARQELGERLVDLPRAKLEKLDLPDELLEAIDLAQRLTKRGALKRQRQYIGVLMRSLDAGPIERAMAAMDQGREQEARLQHRAEQCRDRLLAGDDGCLQELINEFPDIDIQHLRGLVRNAGRETEAGKPPRSARLLFRYLRELFSTGESKSD